MFRPLQVTHLSGKERGWGKAGGEDVSFLSVEGCQGIRRKGTNESPGKKGHMFYCCDPFTFIFTWK